MTIEEYIVKEKATGYKPEQIIFRGFKASPSRVYSEWTSEDFSAIIKYSVRGTDLANENEVFDLYLGEEDVCDFLNEMYPVEES